MRYEYRIAQSKEPLSAKQLNEEFGAEGWELVDMFRNIDGTVYHYFKKEIEENK